MIGSDDANPEPGGNAGQDAALRPSRTRARRDAAAVSALGLRLLQLRPAELDRLELDEPLRDEIERARQLTKNALQKQKRLIAKLLRERDHAAIETALAARKGVRDGDDRAASAGGESARWCDRLLSEGDEALQGFVEANPEADRSQLRQLVRSATRQPATKATRRAEKELARAVAAAMSAASPEPGD